MLGVADAAGGVRHLRTQRKLFVVRPRDQASQAARIKKRIHPVNISTPRLSA